MKWPPAIDPEKEPANDAKEEPANEPVKEPPKSSETKRKSPKIKAETDSEPIKNKPVPLETNEGKEKPKQTSMAMSAASNVVSVKEEPSPIAPVDPKLHDRSILWNKPINSVARILQAKNQPSPLSSVAAYGIHWQVPSSWIS
jgi:hypothetical protein